jgi:membrane protease YdiL (CAAX protease family)
MTGLDGGAGSIPLTTWRLARAFGLELALSGTLGVWLWRRGWRPHRTATYPFGGKDLVRGFGLWLGTIAAVAGWILLCRSLMPGILAVAVTTRFSGRPAWGIAVPFVLFNAVFEEFLWLGLGVAAFRRYGLVRAAALSVGLRVLAHVYQGPLALVTILPMALIFTLYYARSQRLWPVVVAHAFQDLLALGLLIAGVSGRIAR